MISDARICDNVTKPIPAVDRGRADPLNIIGVITGVSDNNNTVNGVVLNPKYSRNQFDVYAIPPFNLIDISTDKNTSLRCSVKRESNCGGQGFVRCN